MLIEIFFLMIFENKIKICLQTCKAKATVSTASEQSAQENAF